MLKNKKVLLSIIIAIASFFIFSSSSFAMTSFSEMSQEEFDEFIYNLCIYTENNTDYNPSTFTKYIRIW